MPLIGWVLCATYHGLVLLLALRRPVMGNPSKQLAGAFFTGVTLTLEKDDGDVLLWADPGTLSMPCSGLDLDAACCCPFLGQNSVELIDAP